MIEVKLKRAPWTTRVEAAQIVIPGWEMFTFYAVPALKIAGEEIEVHDVWNICEDSSRCIIQTVRGETIDDAAAATGEILDRCFKDADALRAAIKKAVSRWSLKMMGLS